jgi:hypothetical protein
VPLRIALATAVAVIAIPAVLFAVLSSTSAASARLSRQEAVAGLNQDATSQPAPISYTLMSYAEAHKVAQMVAYADAVEAAKEATFYKDLTFFKDVAFFEAIAAHQRAAAAPTPPPAPATGDAGVATVSGIPAAWVPTAICEEGGRNDPYAGYFGILEWNHFDGYPTAGSAPLAVQLAWEAAHGQGPPDAPGQCHSY